MKCDIDNWERAVATTGQGHPDYCVCNDSVRPINLPIMNALCKFQCVQEEITEN